MRTVLVLVLLLFAVPDWAAHAIPVTTLTIQSGFVFAGAINDFAAGMSLQAPGFAFGADGTGGGPTYQSGGLHRGQQKGVPADYSGNMTVNPVNSGMSVTFVDSPFTYSGSFTFAAVIPNPQPGSASAPFSFTGDVLGRSAATGEEVFHLLLDGGGVVQAFFSDPAPFCAPCPALNFAALRFEFATVPEPATGLLLAGGLAGLMYFRKRLAPRSGQ